MVPDLYDRGTWNIAEHETVDKKNQPSWIYADPNQTINQYPTADRPITSGRFST